MPQIKFNITTWTNILGKTQQSASERTPASALFDSHMGVLKCLFDEGKHDLSYDCNWGKSKQGNREIKLDV